MKKPLNLAAQRLLENVVVMGGIDRSTPKKRKPLSFMDLFC
ncbi:MAG: hypothetical protein ROZ37_11155 [Aromatoleum sp.]|jgi:hypothetical protein|nr:hypothetical protein [Aromatoleum sp.]MDT3670875.1 hypothetical protein [Aromatoleum sp.]